MRIVSLIPSGTDAVAALGLGDALVGVSHECDHEISTGLPVLTSSVLPTGAAPATVDALVSETAAAGQPLYRTDMEMLRELRPDVVVTQDVCDVCAVDARSVGCDLPPGAEMVLLSATTLAGLEDDLRRLGKSTGAEDRAEDLIDDLRTAQAETRRRVSGKPRPRVVTLEWGDPPFLGGHWVPELVEIAGGDHVLSQTGERSRRATWEEIAAARPDVIVFMPCGYTLAEAEREAATLPMPVRATDATHLFSRCTPQSVSAALDTLAEILHAG